MVFNYKLFFKYIFFHKKQIFLKYLYRNDKNLNIFITSNDLYYLSLHMKLSSLFYSTQLIDLFVYETPVNRNLKLNNTNKHIPSTTNSILVYNFHSIFFQQRFFIFIVPSIINNIKKKSKTQFSTSSIAELFLNANWLEREASELHGVLFSGKKDLRNLLLPYGDTSAPMRKSFPAIGIREIFYDSVTDLLIQSPVTIQF